MVLTYLMLLGMLKIGPQKLAMDQPNERSLHTVSVPRTGGLALMAGFLLGCVVLWQPSLLTLQACVLFLMLLSFLDDLYGLSASLRLLAHIAAAGIFLVISLPLSANWHFIILLGAAFVWMTNLYNFMDGSDGLAGGMAVFGFGSYAVAAWLAGDINLAGASTCIAASALAFLKFNFHPARIFMGDAGSIPLGFLSCAIGLLGWQRGLWPAWFPLLVFSPFIVDASLTLLKRVVRGEKVWEAHRSHYYQRLIRMGWGHRKTALWEYLLMVLVDGSAVILIFQPAYVQWGGGVYWALVFSVFCLQIDLKWNRSKIDQI